MSFVLGRLAEGTRVVYDIGWKQWSRFCNARKRDPILRGEDAAVVREDEEVLLDFVVHLVAVMGRTSGTTRGKLFAVRAAHLSLGLPDPLLGKTRVFFALAGIRRREGAAKRKKPVTIEMLKRARVKCSAMGRRGIVLWAAIAVGFFFLLRASEYVEVEGAPWHLRRVVKGSDLILRRSGCVVEDVMDADELVLRIPGSKTDQYNVGCVRNHYLAGCDICPVRAVQELAREFPERWGVEATLPAFRGPDDMLLTRLEIQTFLTVLGAELGFPPGELGSHSLRIGGATAMYHATKDVINVQRFGRWLGQAFHSYLWEAYERQQGLAAQMAEGGFHLTQ